MKIHFYIIVIVVLFLTAGCQPSDDQRKAPKALNGQIDLADWQLSRDGQVPLDGDWRFYWNRLVSWEEIQNSEPVEAARHYSIPSTWNGYMMDGVELTGIGYATFILDLKLNQSDIRQPLAIFIGDQDSSFQLALNGKYIASSGTVGTSKEDSVPRTLPKLVRFSTDRTDNILILQLSNFDYLKGGPWSSLILGTDDEITRWRGHRFFIDALVIGGILIMAIYHLVLAGLRQSDRSAFFFGLFCLLIALRSLVTGDRYLITIFPTIGFEARITLEFLSFYLAVPAFFAYARTLFPQEVKKFALILATIIGGAFSLIVAVTPALIFGRTLTAYQIFTLVSGFYILFAIGIAFKNKREGSWIIAIGFLIMFATAVNDILHANEVIHTSYLISIGFLLFIFSQAYLLSQRFARTFRTVEHQKDELVRTNKALVTEANANRELTISLKESHQKFHDSRLGLILGLAKLAEYRDEDTGMHLERMREYTKILAEEMSKMEAFKGYISEEYIEDIYQSAILHDIGKVGIKDSVLLKPGKLSKEEFEIIKGHPEIGGDAIKQVELKIQIRSFLTLGRDIAYYHHEKWNGSGYPFQLKGENIPLSARIVALADVYDALTSERPYKEPFSHDRTAEIIIGDSGSHFDPSVVEAFKISQSRFDEIRNSLQE